jgi:3-isopropylmalate/(R)-2-methylmalate dehydratase small subunit
MEPFTTHTGIIATLNRSNVDTDQIIPKQFLKSILRSGYGISAFFDWRYTADGKPNPEFELNHSRFDGRSVLVTRNNFGCGSSREHAVWALAQDDYRVIIAPWKEINGERVPGFADIFRNNSVKNGLLLVELTEKEVERIFALVADHEGLQATVDLAAQKVTVHAPDPVVFSFEIEEGDKERLIGGLDDIAISLHYESDITRFEQSHPEYFVKVDQQS